MAQPAPSKSFLPLDTLFDNPVFAGGVGIAGLGAAAALARRATIQGAGLIKRRLLVNVELSKQDASYKWMLRWLGQHRAPKSWIEKKLTRINYLSLSTKSRATQEGDLGRPLYAQFRLQPGYGKYFLKYKNAYIQVDRAKQSNGSMMGTEPHETLTFTTLYAHRLIFEDIFKEAHQMALSDEEGKTVMYTVRGMSWEKFGDARRKRPLDSVILDKGIKETIVADVKEFLGKHSWYADRGIPYRRGYLLYGPPGSGKSSFIQALAGELNFSIAIVNLSERGMSDDKLADLITKLPARTILLLEDADSAFNNRRQVDADGYSGATVTFSGLLNALDGVAAGEERVAFLTTNHVDRMDEALIRPGRVDMTVRIGEATRYQAAEMWNRFYGDLDTEGEYRERFLKKLEELELLGGRLRTSTAAIQGLFLYNKDDMEGAIGQAEGLVPKTYVPEIHEAVKVPA